MVNEIKVQVCDECNIIQPDVNCSNNTCMDCGKPLVVAIFTRQPTQPAPDWRDSAPSAELTAADYTSLAEANSRPPAIG